MPTLSSRPPQPAAPTKQEVMEAAQPSVNIVTWLSQTMKFQDNHPRTVAAAANVIEEALECMMLEDFAVVPIPGTPRHIVYEVAVQPLQVHALVYFKVQFDIL